MVTGDHAKTAVSVARLCGMVCQSRGVAFADTSSGEGRPEDAALALSASAPDGSAPLRLSLPLECLVAEDSPLLVDLRRAVAVREAVASAIVVTPAHAAAAATPGRTVFAALTMTSPCARFAVPVPREGI